MTLDDYIEEIALFFLPTRRDVLAPLDPEEYVNLLSLIDEAIDAFPGESVFWFWRGWALQFYAEIDSSLLHHPNFELIEDAYERVLDLNGDWSTLPKTEIGIESEDYYYDQGRPEAHFMLAYLYWDAVRRARPAVPAASNEPEAESAGEQAVGLDAARRQWWFFSKSEGLSQIPNGSWFYFHPFDPPVWSVLLEEMMEDVVDKRDLPELYFLWGYAWSETQANMGADRRKRGYEQARRLFSKGAKFSGTNFKWELCCQANLARYQSQSFGGNSFDGLRELGLFAHRLASGVQRNEIPVPKFHAIPQVYYFDGAAVEGFLLENPDLEKEEQTVAIIEKLRELNYINPARPNNPKLAWYFGRCHLNQGKWKQAEEYLRLAHEQMPLEPDLIVNLVVALEMQDRTDESAKLLRTLPEQTIRDTLLRRLAERDAIHSQLFLRLEQLPAFMERTDKKLDTVYGLVSHLNDTLTSALQEFQMPNASAIAQADTDIDAIAERVAELVGKKFDSMIAGQSVLLENIRRKCQSDLYRSWRVLPQYLQEQIVVGETMHVLFAEYSVPQCGALIIQWGKIVETMLNAGFLTPFAAFLDAQNYRTGIPIDTRKVSHKISSDPIRLSSRDGNWNERIEKLRFGQTVGILYAAQEMGDQHISYAFLKAQGFEVARIDRWVLSVPDPINMIREWRNTAAHQDTPVYLSDALEVRSTLFAGGLLSQVAALFAVTGAGSKQA